MKRLAINQLTYGIIGAAARVHQKLGPGLLEKPYEDGLAIEFDHDQLIYSRQHPLPLIYDGRRTSRKAYLADFIVDGRVIVEVKAVKRWDPLFDAQMITYLKLSGCKVGLLINFNVPNFWQGAVRRLVLDFDEDTW